MIERRPRQFLAVWSDDGKAVKGSTYEESLFVDGAFWKNELSSVPLDGFDAFGKLFSSELQSQHDQLAKDKEQLVKDLAAMTAERDSLVSQKEAAEAARDQLAEQVASEKAATAASHEAALATKQESLDAANATIQTKESTIQAMQTRIEFLMSELPFNPRIIDATYFYNRVTKDEFAALSVADDETLRTIAKTILAYKTNDWPVVFESPEFQGLIGYLVGTSFLTAERAAELTKDATRAEAYDAA